MLVDRFDTRQVIRSVSILDIGHFALGYKIYGFYVSKVLWLSYAWPGHQPAATQEVHIQFAQRVAP